MSISYGNVASKVVERSTLNQNAGKAVRGNGDVRHRNPGTGIQEDTRAPKPLNQTRPTNGNACLRVDVNPQAP